MLLSAYMMPGIPKSSLDNVTPNRKAEIIRQVVCEEFCITDVQFFSKGRYRPIVDARHIYFYFMRNLTGANLKDIGDPFHQDHTTVIHGINKVRDLIRSDIFFAESLNELYARVNSKIKEFKNATLADNNLIK